MAIKIKKNGVVQDLVINASEVRVLDTDGNFRSKNLESVLKELNATGGTGTGGGGMLKEAEYVFVGDTEPDYEGVWLDTSEDSTEVVEGDNAIVKAIRDYIDTDVKAIVDKNKELVQENNKIVNDIQTNVGNRLDVVPQLSNPNLLINDSFQVWQRGTSFNTVDYDNKYSCDRWRINHYGSAVYKNITLEKTENGLRVSNTDTDKHNFVLTQVFEDSMVEKLKGKTVTMSVKLKINSVNVGEVFRLILNSDNTNWVTEEVGSYQTVSNTDVTQDIYNTFSFTRILPDDISKFAVQLFFPLESQSIVDIEYIKLEMGAKATPFVPRPYGEELALCQRYYEIIDRVFRTTGFTLGDGMFVIEYPFLVEKRVPPTVVLPSDKTGLIEVVGARNSTPTNLESFTTIDGVRFTGVLADDTNRIVGLNFRTYADSEIY